MFTNQANLQTKEIKQFEKVISPHLNFVEDSEVFANVALAVALRLLHLLNQNNANEESDLAA